MEGISRKQKDEEELQKRGFEAIEKLFRKYMDKYVEEEYRGSILRLKAELLISGIAKAFISEYGEIAKKELEIILDEYQTAYFEEGPPFYLWR